MSGIEDVESFYSKAISDDFEILIPDLSNQIKNSNPPNAIALLNANSEYIDLMKKGRDILLSNVLRVIDLARIYEQEDFSRYYNVMIPYTGDFNRSFIENFIHTNKNTFNGYLPDGTFNLNNVYRRIVGKIEELQKIRAISLDELMDSMCESEEDLRNRIRAFNAANKLRISYDKLVLKKKYGSLFIFIPDRSPINNVS